MSYEEDELEQSPEQSLAEAKARVAAAEQELRDARETAETALAAMRRKVEERVGCHVAPDTYFEWCVMHPYYPQDPHRGPMTYDDAVEWIRTWEIDLPAESKKGMFYLAKRRVGRWEQA